MNTRTNVKSNSSASSASAANTLPKGLMVTAGVAATVMGLWAAACFVGAAVSSGPISLIQGWFAAVSGM